MEVNDAARKAVLASWDGPMTPLLREQMRVLVMAEDTIAWRVDPNDTMTTFEAIKGHRDEVVDLYVELLDSDSTYQMMLGNK